MAGSICISRRSKYGAKKTIVDGIKFDSKAEATRYATLKALQRVGMVKNLRLQVAYKLTVNGSLICKYIADFVYLRDGVEVVEDVKGVKTREYILKRKLMKACFGIVIKETK
jgi:hypothetical protein